jgi:KaiC/GvpD/RAD55 family RecA-like ATPase
MTGDVSKDKSSEKKEKVTLKQLNNYNKKQLKALCSEHGLATFGTRVALFDRLINFFDLDSGEKDDKKDERDGLTKEKSESKGAEGERDKKPGKVESEKLKSVQKESEDGLKATEVEKSIDSKEKKLDINDLFKLNLARDNKGDLESVLKQYDSLLKDHPGNSYILVNKGICLQYLQDYNGAVKCYIDALKINPDNIEARMLLEGCRVMGVVEAKLKETVEEEIEGDATAKPEVERPKIQSKEVDKAKTEEPSISKSKVLSLSKDLSAKKPATDGEKENEEKPGLTDKIPEKIQISGTQASGNNHKSLFGDDFGSIDTKVLTASKTKLTSVLDELKSELHKPSDGRKVEESPEGSAGSDQNEMKGLDLEKQSLRKMLDEKKSDEDFGSKVLDSARKLLLISETLDSTSAELDRKISENGELAGVEKKETEVKDKEKVKEEKDAETKAEPKPKRKRPTEQVRCRTGNISFDKLTQGGILSGSNILVDGPPFVGKEILLYKFASLGFKMNIPCIIVNPETAPDTIRDTFKSLLGDLKEFEDKKLIYWLDPELDEMKERFKREDNGELPELHQLLLDGLDAFSDEIFEKYDSYNLIFFSMTPVIMFQEPKVINRFLSRFSKKIKDDNVIAMYTIDNTMHERQDLNFVRRVMEGIVEIKQEEAHADHANPRNLLKIDKLPYAGSFDWHEYKYDEKNFDIKAIHKYKSVG